MAPDLNLNFSITPGACDGGFVVRGVWVLVGVGATGVEVGEGDGGIGVELGGKAWKVWVARTLNVP